MKDLTAFNNKFRVEYFKVDESKYWIWSLRPLQPTLGAGILSLKRYANSFSDITLEEGKDLSIITKLIEKKLYETFNYDKINYLMLMMVDPHLHFHIIPRYSRAVEFENMLWVDKGWPGLPNLDSREISENMLLNIKKALE